MRARVPISMTIDSTVRYRVHLVAERLGEPMSRVIERCIREQLPSLDEEARLRERFNNSDIWEEA